MCGRLPRSSHRLLAIPGHAGSEGLPVCRALYGVTKPSAHTRASQKPLLAGSSTEPTTLVTHISAEVCLSYAFRNL